MQKNENDNKIVFELNLRFQIKNYGLKYFSKSGSAILALLIILKLLFWYYNYKT